MEAVVHAGRDFHTLVGQRDCAVAGHEDVAVLPQFLHGDTDTRLREPQTIHDVNGMHLTVSEVFFQREDGFQIIFRGLMNDHGTASCSVLFAAEPALGGGEYVFEQTRARHGSDAAGYGGYI